MSINNIIDVTAGLTNRIEIYVMDDLNHNTHELIAHNRYNQVKSLLGYMGLKTKNYDLYRMDRKDIEIDVAKISCGHLKPIEINGNVYAADDGVGGGIVARSNPIAGAGRLELIYQTARITTNSSPNMEWNIPTLNTNHKIKLRFADFYSAFYRNGNIFINNKMRKQNFNPFIIVGRFVRIDLDMKIPVTNGNINIRLDNGSILNAIEIIRLDKDDVKFTNITRDDPVSNKDVYLFINKNFTASKNIIKKKFLSIQKEILRSRNTFFY